MITKTKMSELSEFYPSKYLHDDEAVAHYISLAIEDGGPGLLAAALGDVARARGMTISSAEGSRHGSVTINLDDADQDLIASLASAKNSTPHHLMRSAILEYLQKEETRQNFIAVAESSLIHCKETGLHITLDEFDSWVDQVQQDPSAPLPTCHK